MRLRRTTSANSIDPSSVVEPYALDPRRGGSTRGWAISRQPIPSSEGRSPVDRGVDQQRRREAGDVGEILGIARFKFHEGKVEEYKRLSAQAMEIVRTKDTGTLQYEIYFNDDESEAVVIERFRDSEALIEHGANLAEIGEAVLATGTAEGQPRGEPDEQLRAKVVEGEQ